MFDLIKIRQELHKQPELSGYEKKTSKKIKDYLKLCNPDNIIAGLAGYGILAVFDTKRPGPSILLRAELDALPIKEENNLLYSSKTSSVSHSCGHDGHMSILLGVAEQIYQNKNDLCGKIYLLFQPAEEIAQGAKKVLESDIFKSLKIDYAFALHNLPGFKKGSIILKKDVFAATSKGLIVRLKGKSSHAGHPENGINPIFAMIEIIDGLEEISKEMKSEEDRSLITIIHVKLGEVAFGTSPGDGVVMATFRSTDDEKMDHMSKKAISLIKEISSKNNLKHEIEWVEIFPILINDSECVDLVEKASRKKSLDVTYVDGPFSWTEDFSYFTQNIKGCFFGLGSGKDHPQLHNSDYDFPDEIINYGVDLFFEIIKEILGGKEK
jgi:amidohydrolase